MAPMFEVTDQSSLTRAGVKVLIKNVNDCLISKYVCEWYEQINGMPKLRTYKTLNTAHLWGRGLRKKAYE
jgi:hypothetical protein